jgi:hypothetical protein
MDEPVEGSPEHFFAAMGQFLKVNAIGEVRCLLLVETGGGQFWIQGMMDSKVWVHGMLKLATTLTDAKVAHEVFASAKLMEQQIKEQDLMATEVKGKAQ